MNAENLELGFRSALRLRLLGILLVTAGVLVLVVLAIGSALHASSVVLVTAVLVVLVLFAVAGTVLIRRRPVIRADGTGYRVRFIRGAGVMSARWDEVEGLATTSRDGVDYVVMQLRNGRSTTIPVAVLAMDKERFVQALQALLDAAHGYRPLQ